MADAKRTPKGTFAPGTSGNPGGGKAKKYRADGWVNFFTGHGVYGQDKRQGASFQTARLTFDQLIELWNGDDLAARAVETLPKEATREGFDIVIPENEDGSDESELISDITQKLNDLQATKKIFEALKAERGLGGSVVMIGANDGQSDLTKPLNIDRVRSIDWLTMLEAREVTPVYGYSDPSAPKYGDPEIYRISSRSIFPPKNGAYTAQTIDIHESRLLVFPGIRVSRYQPVAVQNGWGDSVLVRMYRVLRDFNLAWGSAGTLVADFASAVYKMKDLWETLGSADGAAAFAERLASMNLAKSTINATVIDAEDEFKREQTPIAGLPDLMDKFATRLAAAADMPLTLLFGTSPGGLNATGESDIRFFYDKVSSFQRDCVEPHLRKLIKIVIKAMGKEEPDKWSVQFRPLWQESAQDRAQAMYTQAQADAIWIDRSVISAEEVADAHWGSGEWNPEIKIDFDARDKQEQTVAAPVNQDDKDILDPNSPKYAPSKLDPAHPKYIAPPPDPNAKPAFGKPGAKSGNPAGKPKPKAQRKDGESLKYICKVQGKFHVYNERLDGSVRVLIGAFSKKADALACLRADYSEEEARDANGKWTSGGGSDGAFHAPTAHALLTAASQSEAAGRGAGFTYSPAEGKFKTEGYSVSIHPEHEATFHGKAIDESTVASYVGAKEGFFRSHPDAHIGGWYNPDDDHWYLDVSHVTSNKQEAVGLGARYNQKGIYDLKEGRTIGANEYGEIAAGDRGDRQDRVRSAQDVSEGDRGCHECYPPRGASQTRSAGRLDYSPDQPRDADGKFASGGGSSGESAGGRVMRSTEPETIAAPKPSWKGKAEGAKDTKAAYFHDGKWDQSRLAHHDEYVHVATDSAEKSKGPQTVYMTGGGPASGKTTAILENPAAGFPVSGIGQKAAAFISADDAKEAIPEFAAAKAAGDQSGAGFVHEESAHMSKLAMAKAIAQGKDVVYDSTGDGGIKDLTDKVTTMRNQGVKRVVANYVTIDPDEAVARSVERGKRTGRYVDPEVTRGIHTLVSRTASAAMQGGLFDEAKLWDNSGTTPKLVASYEKGRGLVVQDKDNWDAFIKRGNAPLPPGWE